MTSREYLEAKKYYFALYGSLAPKTLDFNKIHKELKDLEKESKDYHANMRYLVGRLYDGLAYGNW